MIKGHKIEKRVEVQNFISIIEEFSGKDVSTTKHTFFRLKEADRKIFKESIIKECILRQDPVYVGIQFNGLYAVFYGYGKDMVKMILDIQSDKIYVVTFYIISKGQIPRI